MWCLRSGKRRICVSTRLLWGSKECWFERGKWRDVVVSYRYRAIGGGVLLFLSAAIALLPSWIVPGLCLLAMVGIGIVRRPYLALLLLFACAGFPSLILPLAEHNMHIIEPAIVLALIVILLRRPSLHIRIPHLLAVLFLVIACISFLHVPQFSTSKHVYGADKRLLELLIMGAAFFCGTLLTPDIDRASAFLVAILLVNLPPCLIGLGQALGLHFLENPGAASAVLAQGRLWGPFAWPVNFGMYLLNLFIIALSCWLLGARRSHRVIGSFLTLVTAIEIVGTGTRSVLLAALVVLLAACCITKRWKSLWLCLLTMCITGVLFFSTIVAYFNHDITSTSNRLLLWQETLKLILAHPWIGIGLQQFPSYYSQLIVGKAAELGTQGIHPHQQYLEWAVESGIFWAVTGVLLLLAILLTCVRAYRVVPNKARGVFLAALLVVLANGIVGFLDAPLDQLEGAVVFFLLTGAALGMVGRWQKRLHHIQLEEKTRDLRVRQRSRLATCTLIPATTAKTTRAHIAIIDEKRSLEKAGNRENHANLPKTGRSILTQLLSWAVVLPFTFFTTALLTRYLGPIQYGEYSLTFPFLTFFALLGGTSMDDIILRQLSCEPLENWSTILSNALTARLLMNIVSIVVAIATTFLLPIANEQRMLFLVGSISLFFSFSFNGVRLIFSHGFRAEQRIGVLALLEMFNRLLTGLLVVCIVWLRLSLFYAYLVLVFSDIPLFLLQVWLASSRFTIRLRFRFTGLQEHLRDSLSLLGQKVLLLLAGQIDISVLLLVDGPISVGVYALASRLVDPLSSILFAYTNGLYPLLCATYQDGQSGFVRTYQYALSILALCIIPLAVFVCAQARLLVTLLGGASFIEAANAVQWLIWAMVLTFLQQVTERAYLAIHLERRLPLITAVQICCNLLANVLLVPHWHVLGVAIASVISEGCGLSLSLLLIRRHIPIVKVVSKLLLIAFCNGPAIVFLFLAQTLPFFWTLPLSALLTINAYLMTQVLTVQEIYNACQLLTSRSMKKVAFPKNIKKQKNMHEGGREQTVYSQTNETAVLVSKM